MDHIRKLQAASRRTDLSPGFRQSIQEAIAVVARETSFGPHRPTRSDAICSAVACLVDDGIFHVQGMEADVWLLRMLRDLESARRP